MLNQCSYHVLNSWFFSYFYPIRKYSKYSLMNLTFFWECNDTPSLIKIKVGCLIYNILNLIYNIKSSGILKITLCQVAPESLKLYSELYNCRWVSGVMLETFVCMQYCPEPPQLINSNAPAGPFFNPMRSFFLSLSLFLSLWRVWCVGKYTYYYYNVSAYKSPCTIYTRGWQDSARCLSVRKLAGQYTTRHRLTIVQSVTSGAHRCPPDEATL